jgi:hypothetical protein
MKISEVLTIGRVTPLNVEDALSEVRECISDTEDNLRSDREYIRKHPRAFGLARIQLRRDGDRDLLRSLKRREQRCLRLLQVA